MKADQQHIIKSLKRILAPDQITELRVLSVQKREGGFQCGHNGYYDYEHIHKLASDAVALEHNVHRAAGYFYTPNPVDPALHARATNRLVQSKSGALTSDSNIIARRWLLVDIDPVRPSGVSSTDEQHHAAMIRSDEIIQGMSEEGWPAPLRASSGNGIHLMYRIDLPNDKDATALVSKVLSALDLRYSDAAVKVDQTCSNAARIWKIPGTMATKGDKTPDRPHRRAQLFDEGGQEYVMREQLEQLAAEVPEAPPAQSPAARGNGSTFDIEQFISEHGLDVEPAQDWNAGRKWRFRQCPFSSDHSDGAVLMQHASGAISVRCHHDSCTGKDWKYLREMYDPGYRDKQQKHHSTPQNTWPDPTQLAQAENISVEYPISMLPACLRSAVEESARFDKVHPASPASVGLSALALAAGKRLLVEEKPGLQHHPTFFFFILAISGERKSPVFSRMAYPVEKWEYLKQRDHNEDKAKHRAQTQVINSSVTSINRKVEHGKIDIDEATLLLTDLERQRKPLPPDPRKIVDDVTEQRLVQMLGACGGEIGVFSAEGRGVLDQIAGKYSQKDFTGEAVYLKGFSGDTIRRDRKGDGGEQVIIQRPCLNLCVMVQPDRWSEFSSIATMEGSGMLARMWPARVPSMVGKRFEIKNEMGLQHRRFNLYNNAIETLLNADMRDSEGEHVPHIAKLSDGADDIRIAMANKIEDQITVSLSDCADIVNKIVSQMIKLAGVLHVANNPNVMTTKESEIDVSTMECASILTQWYLIESINSRRSALTTDRVMSIAVVVLSRLSVIGGGKRCKAGRDIQRFIRPRPKDTKEVIEALTLLAEHGWCREINQRGKRQRTPIWEIHPEIHKFFTPEEADDN